MVSEKIFREFKSAGKELFQRGLVATKSGSMSVLTDTGICITKHGSMLGSLKKRDILELDLKSKEIDEKASMDAKIHLEIYRSTSWNAVVHAHPVYSSLLSLHKTEIKPIDVEGEHYFHEVNVVFLTKNIAKGVAAALKKSKIAVARAHGTYAGGETLHDALFWTTSLEHSSKLLFLNSLRRKRL